MKSWTGDIVQSSGHIMAYRGETTEMMAVVAQAPVLDAAPVVVAKPAVAPADWKRVRFAIGLVVLLAVIDLCLYLPRLF
jgi:hypothetical protein